MDLLFLFEWLDTSFIASLSKAYGGVFAVVQMLHLLAMAMLGGMVMVGDLRLLGVLMKDVPAETVAQQTDKWFGIALSCFGHVCANRQTVGILTRNHPNASE